MYMVQYTDNMWYRGSVQKQVPESLNPLGYEVFFVDFGNKGTVEPTMQVF